MEKTMKANPPAPTGQPDPMPEPPKNDHWFVQTVGGMTLANTMVAGLTMFYLWMAYVVVPGT